MPCNTPVDITMGSHIYRKCINELLCTVLVGCTIFPGPALVNTGKHSCIGIGTLDRRIEHTECLLIFQGKSSYIIVACIIPRIIIINFITDDPVRYQACCCIAVSLCEESHNCLQGFCPLLLICIKCIMTVARLSRTRFYCHGSCCIIVVDYIHGNFYLLCGK